MSQFARRCRSSVVSALVVAGWGLVALPSAAQQARPLLPPPSAMLSFEDSDLGSLAANVASTEGSNSVPPRAVGAEVSYELAIEMVDGVMFNPATGKDDPVRLRAYTGPTVMPSAVFAAPTVNIWPGETFRLTLNNKLPIDPSCSATEDINIPHCFNATNMHTHGLWVSPAGNSDNVLLSIEPGVSFQYEYNIPADHPAGTFWYHSHRHGSTALQVSSGMAGALIIRGDRPPSIAEDGSWMPGDVDVLLKGDGGLALEERIFLFQQIAYACREADGSIKANPDRSWRCDEGDVGTLQDYDQLGPRSWFFSARHTSINGVVLPTVTGAVAGVPERWRLIHGGVRDTIKLMVRKSVASPQDFSSQGTGDADRSAFVDANCVGDPIETLGLAADGLTRNNLDPRKATVLQPGYREDLLVVFPEPGAYCIIDGSLEVDETVNSQPHGRELLAIVEVGGTAVADTTTEVVKRMLIAAAKNLPEEVAAPVIADLEDLGLSAFTKHSPIASNELTGARGLGFQIASGFEIGELETGPDGKLRIVRPAQYDPARLDRELMLGDVEEWTLTSFRFGHPFHIHVNPFEIVEILDKEGNDVSGPGDPGVQQYANLKGVWKDTIFVQEDYVIKVRTRYERYIGDFVLHCHILDHEDQGMMQNVRISVPGPSGTPSHTH